MQLQLPLHHICMSSWLVELAVVGMIGKNPMGRMGSRAMGPMGSRAMRSMGSNERQAGPGTTGNPLAEANGQDGLQNQSPFSRQTCIAVNANELQQGLKLHAEVSQSFIHSFIHCKRGPGRLSRHI